MGSAVDTLMGMAEDPSRFNYTADELHDLQITAMDERLQEGLDKIRYLEFRSANTETTKINTLKDVVPLLFPNPVYKHYPSSFLTEGKWDKLTKWVELLSTHKAPNINLDGISNIDDWLTRMYEVGHCLTTTSGTSNIPAILSSNRNDVEWLKKDSTNTEVWATGVLPKKNRYQIATGPTITNPKSKEIIFSRIEDFCRSDNPNWEFPAAPLSTSYLIDSTVMRNKIRSGNATDEEVFEFEQMNMDRQTELERGYVLTAEHIIENRHEILDIVGMWTGLYSIAKIVRDKGYSAKDFNPDNAFYAGGGLKGSALPDDYAEFVRKTFNISPDKYYSVYSMQELNSKMPSCKSGNFHIPPWVVPVLLEPDAGTLLDYNPKKGTYSGRAAFFDVSIDGRWGGIITGDYLTINFDSCECGLKGPTITNINRDMQYFDMDKFNCSVLSVLGHVG